MYRIRNFCVISKNISWLQIQINLLQEFTNEHSVPVAKAAAISIPVAVVFGRLSCSARSRGSSLEVWRRANSASSSSSSLFPPRGSTGLAGPPSQPTTRVPAVSYPNHSSSRKFVLKRINKCTCIISRQLEKSHPYTSILIDLWWLAFTNKSQIASSFFIDSILNQ